MKHDKPKKTTIVPPIAAADVAEPVQQETPVAEVIETPVAEPPKADVVPPVAVITPPTVVTVAPPKTVGAPGTSVQVPVSGDIASQVAAARKCGSPAVVIVRDAADFSLAASLSAGSKPQISVRVNPRSASRCMWRASRN